MRLKGGKLLLDLSNDFGLDDDDQINVPISREEIECILSKGLIVMVGAELQKYVYEPHLNSIDFEDKILSFNTINYTDISGNGYTFTIDVYFGEESKLVLTSTAI